MKNALETDQKDGPTYKLAITVQIFYTVQVDMLHPSISGIHGFPPLLLPQLRRARHLQEEAHARQGPASGVRDEGEEIIINCGDFSEKLTPHAHCTR